MNQTNGEYIVTRLNRHGPERFLLSPQIVSSNRTTFPGFNETCVLEGNTIADHAYLRRSERRCTFPEELQHSWNYTYHDAKDVTFAKKTFTLHLFNGGEFTFDCNVKDGDLYVFRSFGFATSEVDGILCMNITRLTEDQHYLYEMTRFNSGDQLDGLVKLFPNGKPVELTEHCDWLESPARPEYLY